MNKKEATIKALEYLTEEMWGAYSRLSNDSDEYTDDEFDKIEDALDEQGKIIERKLDKLREKYENN